MRSNLRQRLMYTLGLVLATALLLLLFVGLTQAKGPDDLDEARIVTTSHAASSAISAEQAAALALNDLTATDDGYEVRNPQHMANFTAAGLTFTPRRGGPAWSWQLTSVSAAQVDLGAVMPHNADPGMVAYPRGGLVERYLFQADSVEQQFVIPAPLALNEADLVIAGAVRSDGDFAATSRGWLWRTAEGVVSLGDVYVFDAAGRELPATMEVTADETRIVVDGVALAQAAYPVTVDPEVGTNDFRISDMGATDGNTAFKAVDPAVAYNSINNEYLVVWEGEDDTDFGSGPLVDGEEEIFGQRINAATGAEVGTNDFRISDMGATDGSGDYDARNPAVAYNSTNNEYLVVWYGDDDTGSLIDNENEIFGQRINGATGAEVGTNDFRISDMGGTGNTTYAAYNAAVAYNSTNNEYLVVWYGDDDIDSLVDDENEIFGQRIYGDRSSGDEVGNNDFRISDMGGTGNADYDGNDAAVAYNSANNEYLVVWHGEDNTGSLADNEREIWGQRIYGDRSSGDEVGNNDFRISDMGTTDGDTTYNGYYAAVAYNSANNEYLVVWQGDDDVGGLANDEGEIFAQRIYGDRSSGDEVGTNDFRVSDMGGIGDANYDASQADVTYNSTDNEYLVVWQSDDNTGGLVDNEWEIFGQRLNGATGGEVGDNDFRLSDMGGIGNTTYNGWYADVAYNSTNNECLVVWYGDDNTGSLADNESEAFGQRWAPPAPDLSIIKSVTPSAAYPGEAITYTLTFSNAGSALASGILITDRIPVSLTVQSVISNCDVAITQTVTGGYTYTWSVGDLDQNQGGIITITGQLSATLPHNHTFENVVTITTADADSDSGNNSSTAIFVTHCFSEAVDAPLVGIQRGSAAWGDYDNDGDLDIFSTGRESGTDPYVTKIYRNDGADVFVTTIDTLVGTQYHFNSVPWGDYDNDGDLDILIAGNSSGAVTHVARVYRNDGSDTFNAAVTETTLTGYRYDATAWGDYDNDGDLDIFITGYDGANLGAKVYRNDGADTFTMAVTTDTLTGLNYAAAAWGDYDNDGDLDILLTGRDSGLNYTARVYRNDGADIFTTAVTTDTLTGVYRGSVAWGDYDNDSDLDIILTGQDENSNYVARVYRNDGADIFTTVVTTDTLAGVQYSSVDWGDYDNDGDLDILLTGWTGSAPVTKIYRNDGSDTFTEVNTDPLENIYEGAAVWGDYDSDGDLDIFLTGRNSGGSMVARIYRNNIEISNLVPGAPSSLSVQVSGTEVELGWAAPSSGSTTPVSGLTYNLYVGTSPSKVDVVPPHAFTTTNPLTNGLRLLPAMGNGQHDLTATLTLTDGLYYWSVQAVDHTFTGSPFATEEQFIIDNQSPDAPVLIAPANSVLISDTTPTLDWNAAADNGPAGVAGYNIQIDTTNVYTVTAPTTNYTPAVLADGVHTWTVRAYDTVGNYGTYTDTWSFTVDATPPGVSALINPADSTVTNTTELTLTWGSVAGAAGYMLDFDGSISDVGNVTESATGVLADGIYTWTVATYDDLHNTSAYTDAWSFTVDTTPPDAPALTSPADSATISDTTPTLTWSPSPSAVGYLLDFDGSVIDVGNSTISTTGVLADGTYTWTVAAYDALNNTSAYTNVWSFTVDTTPPDAPALTSPNDGAIISDTTPTLTWNPSPGAAGYLLDFDGSVVDVGNTTISTTGALADGTYTWTLAAYDALNNTSAYTDVWSFTVDATPPDVPMLVSPANGTVTNTTELTLTWGSAAGAAGYLLDFDGSISDVGNVTEHATGVLADGTYTWTVAAYDDLHNTSTYAAEWDLEMDTTPPEVPTLLGPTDGTVTNTTGLTLTWAASPGAAGYLLDFDGSISDVGNVTESFTGILSDGVYTWTVAAYDGLNNTSIYAAEWDLEVDTIPPAPPVLLSPADGTITTVQTLDLTWAASASPDVAGYLLDFDGTVMDVSDTTTYSTGLLPNNTYTWTVAAYDGSNNTSAYTDTWDFEVNSPVPLPPVLLSPADGTITSITALTLEWATSVSPGVTGYLLDWNGTVMDVGNVTTYATGILADDTYTWTVAAYDGTYTSVYTDVWSFTINTLVPNNPPVAVDDSYTTTQNTVLTVPAPGVLSNDTDDDGDPLTAVLDTGPSNGPLNLGTDGSFIYTPTLGFSGIVSFTYHANDGTDDSNIAIVMLNVTAPANTPPTLSNIVNQSTDAGTPITVTFTISDTETALDALVLSADSSNTALVMVSNITFEGSGTDRTATITPTAGMTGTTTITITVDDGELRAYDTFVLAVSVNAPPEFTSNPTLIGTVGVTYTYDVTTYDADGDTPVITATTLPGWLILTDHGDGTATLTGAPTVADTYDVALEVSDGEDSATQPFTITVAEAPVTDFYTFLPLVMRNY
ncbi:MAG: FG-GAP-like repeat-containing protein [Chloroflexota bacterium]|nr:FG-GAP-like repeat-containing protein [Chloroflexota bacterium]